MSCPVIVDNPDERPLVQDEELVSRMAAGETEAFAAFYDRHSTMLYSLALRILQSPTEAEEVFQDACVQLWERAGMYNPRLGKPISWAIAVVRNRAIDTLRTTQRRARILAASPEDAPGPQGEAPEPGVQLDRQEMAGKLNQALRLLPAAQQQALELTFFRGMTQVEIAEALGEPLGTIKARLRRGMLQLRDDLEGTL